jgi:hypothetical protein
MNAGMPRVLGVFRQGEIRVVSRIRSKASRGDVAAAKRGCVGHDDVQALAANPGDVNMRYQIAPLFCRPWTLLGITPRLIESHYENNYGGAFTRLNAISEELEALDPATTPPHVIRRLKQDEAAALNSLALHELYFASLGADGRAIPEHGQCARARFRLGRSLARRIRGAGEFARCEAPAGFC